MSEPVPDFVQSLNASGEKHNGVMGFSKQSDFLREAQSCLINVP
jgi:hypothetical protein